MGPCRGRYMTSIWFNFLLKIFLTKVWLYLHFRSGSSALQPDCCCHARVTLVDWSQTLSAHYQHSVMCCQPVLSTALPSCVCVPVSVWGVLLCVVRRLWDDLRAERCLPAQSPCLRIKAAGGKLHGVTRKWRKCLQADIRLFFYPLFLVVCPSEITRCSSEVQTTGTRCCSNTGFLPPSISASLLVFFFFFSFKNTFPLSDAARLHMSMHVSTLCVQNTSWFLTVLW